MKYQSDRILKKLGIRTSELSPWSGLRSICAQNQALAHAKAESIRNTALLLSAAAPCHSGSHNRSVRTF